MSTKNTSRRVTLRVVEPAADYLSTEEVEQEVASWIAEGRRRGYSPRTLISGRRWGRVEVHIQAGRITLVEMRLQRLFKRR